MFVSYLVSADEKSYTVKIVDTDFEDCITLPRPTNLLYIFPDVAVIDAYEKRNLPVSPNLIRELLYAAKVYGHSMENLVMWNKKYNPKFAKYEKDIEKYLLLL